MADRYWVGGSGTWNNSSTTNWSATSGGSGGASYPVAGDNVYFDQAGTYTVTVGTSTTVTMTDLNISSTGLTITGVTSGITVNQNLNITGFVVWNSQVLLTFATGTNATAKTSGVVFSGGITISKVNSTTTLTLLDNMSAGSAGTVTFNTGSLVLNNFVLKGKWSSTGAGVRSVDFGTTGYIGITDPGVSAVVFDMTGATNITYTGTPNVVYLGSAVSGYTATFKSGTLAEANVWNFEFTGGSTTQFAFLSISGETCGNIKLGPSVQWNTVNSGNIIYGGLDTSANLPLTTYNFKAGSGTKYITFNSSTTTSSCTINIAASSIATYALSGNMNCPYATFVLTTGTFDAVSYNVSCYKYTISGSGTRTLKMGSGTWTLWCNSATSSWDCTTTTNLTFQAQTSTLEIYITYGLGSSSTTFYMYPGNLTYNVISIKVTSTYSLNFQSYPAIYFNGAFTCAEFKNSTTNASPYRVYFGGNVTMTKLTAESISPNWIIFQWWTTAYTWTISGNSTAKYAIFGTTPTAGVGKIICTFPVYILSSPSTGNPNVTKFAGNFNMYHVITVTGANTVTTISTAPSGNATIHLFGAGGSSPGGYRTGGVSSGSGGGGGAYTKLSVALSASTGYSINVGAALAVPTVPTTGSLQAGSSTVVIGGTTYTAQGGYNGRNDGVNAISAGGAGGAAQTVSGIIVAAYAGGAGGTNAATNAATSYHASCGGAGGAAGPSGAGKNGGNAWTPIAAGSAQGNGGGGGGASGGYAGANATSTAGGNGGNNSSNTGGGVSGLDGQLGGGGGGATGSTQAGNSMPTYELIGLYGPAGGAGGGLTTSTPPMGFGGGAAGGGTNATTAYSGHVGLSGGIIFDIPYYVAVPVTSGFFFLMQ